MVEPLLVTVGVVGFNEPPEQSAVGVDGAAIVGSHLLLSTKNMAPLRSLADSVTDPLPVAPAVLRMAQAAPTDPSSPEVVILSNNSVKAEGFVAVQFE